MTASWIAVVQCSDPIKQYMIRTWEVSLTASIMSIVFMLMIVCCFRKKTPHNYILLCCYTICMTYMVAGLTAVYDRDLVILAGAATALVSISLTIYAMKTKVKMEVFQAILFVLYIAMMPLAIMGAIMRTKALHIVYCSLGLLFYSIFLIVDTMQICKGSTYGGYGIGLDEYIIGALMLYIDIVMIFVYIL